MQLNLIKQFYSEKQDKKSGDLQLVKFHFMTGCQEIKIAILIERFLL